MYSGDNGQASLDSTQIPSEGGGGGYGPNPNPLGGGGYDPNPLCLGGSGRGLI